MFQYWVHRSLIFPQNHKDLLHINIALLDPYQCRKDVITHFICTQEPLTASGTNHQITVLVSTPTSLAIEVRTFGCIKRSSKTFFPINISGENPLVATDARCFMPWIASQYNMKLEEDYEERLNCRNGRGDRNNADQDKCL